MTEEQILEEIRHALLPDRNRPPKAEGWLLMTEIKAATGLSASSVRRHMQDAPDRWDKRMVSGLCYYKLKNGKL